MELLLVLGLIGAEMIMVRSDDLPAPQLSSLTPVVYKDQLVVLDCMAPNSYPEGIFYLYTDSSDSLVERKSAPETKNSVTFTLRPPVTDGTITYTCMYQCWVEDRQRNSQNSNTVNVTILDESTPIDSTQTLQTSLPVPLWVILLVSGIIGFVVLVASVSLIVFLILRSKKKRKEQRDKETIWINQDMDKDWTLSRHNKVFPVVSSLESTAETEMSHPYLTNKNSYTFNGSAAPFSSFRT